MKISEAKVSTKKPPKNATVKHIVYETWEEVFRHPEHGLGEVKSLELLNAQVKTEAMNKKRAEMAKGPTKSSLRSDAIQEIFDEMSAGHHKDAIGNQLVLEAKIDRRMKEIADRRKEVPVSAFTPSEEDEEDDEDEDEDEDEDDDIDDEDDDIDNDDEAEDEDDDDDEDESVRETQLAHIPSN